MKSTIEVKIKAVSGVYTSATVHKTLRKVLVTVIEIPETNYYGNDYEEKAIPFDIEIHNNNIERLAISQRNIGDYATVQVGVQPFKTDVNGPAALRVLVNNLTFTL